MALKFLFAPGKNPGNFFSQKSLVFCLSILAAANSQLNGQTPAAAAPADTSKQMNLREISVRAERSTITRLPPAQGAWVFSGKKNEVIQLENTDANIAEKTARQIFAKIPGVFIYDMDGSGNQINISTRGLDPHRGWEFNTRLNGVIINSDLYGYPASHFSLPLEAVERIELVRGTGALQYGAQFGGMLNYVPKMGDTTRLVSLESISSIGSFGLLSTYNALGGKRGRWQYHAFFSKRVSDGYRENAGTQHDAQAARIRFQATPRLALRAEISRSNYRYQIPGPLNDSMFHADPRQATRGRNFFNPEIWVPALGGEWRIGGAGTLLTWTSSAVLGERRSIQFDKTANVPDALDPATGNFAKRQVDVDGFHSYTHELRLLRPYSIFGKPSSLAAGVQFLHNDLHRQQLGQGSTGSDFDLEISSAGWGRDLHFKTQNVAVFAENRFQISPGFSVSPGLRWESGTSRMSGRIAYLPDNQVPVRIEHRFPLFGINAEFVPPRAPGQNFYAGFAQSYRPVLFKDIIPGSTFERTDPGFHDASGHNLELGWRGSGGPWRWDMSLFRLRYNDRPGTLSITENGQFLLLKTNIGDAVTQGLEAFAEFSFRPAPGLRCNLFTSTALFDAQYLDAQVRVGTENRSVRGNRVESVPVCISRNGANLRFGRWGAGALFSWTGESFADALNTDAASATGSVGRVPGYGLLDLSASFRLGRSVVVRANLNNAADRQYFTKRPTFYPGAGIWPSDGRSINVSVGIRV